MLQKKQDKAKKSGTAVNFEPTTVNIPLKLGQLESMVYINNTHII
jgi:hypothetical protein